MLQFESILLLTCSCSSRWSLSMLHTVKINKNNFKRLSLHQIGAQTLRLYMTGPCWKIECGCLPPVLDRNMYQYSDQLLAVRWEIGLTQYRSLKLILASKYFRCVQGVWDLKILFFSLKYKTGLGALGSLRRCLNNFACPSLWSLGRAEGTCASVFCYPGLGL